MSSFVNLDSILRERGIYPNENKYAVDSKQVETWFKSARTTMAVSQNPSIKPREFATAVNVRYLVVPYTDDLSEVPTLYVNFHSKEYRDIHLISSINGVHRDAKFICTFDKIQNDRLGNPMWIHYRCNMIQVMRFRRGDPVYLEIMGRDGNTLPQQDTSEPALSNPAKQTLVTFETVPYINDNSYSNQTVESYIP